MSVMGVLFRLALMPFTNEFIVRQLPGRGDLLLAFHGESSACVCYHRYGAVPCNPSNVPQLLLIPVPYLLLLYLLSFPYVKCPCRTDISQISFLIMEMIGRKPGLQA